MEKNSKEVEKKNKDKLYKLYQKPKLTKYKQIKKLIVQGASAP